MNGTALYDDVSYELARRMTLRYSSSFGLASRLFGSDIRRHIYAVYGMVRTADEIVDTYDGTDKAGLLAAFQNEVTACVMNGYSTNPIVNAFGITARKFGIGRDLFDPFFASMAMDLTMKSFTKAQYDTYVYGSAEVIGLMCLKVFCGQDTHRYDTLKPGAQLLGSAYQKVNFLRDFGADYDERGRVYFPSVRAGTWNDKKKESIVQEITREFDDAYTYIEQLPRSARASVRLSYAYYSALLRQLRTMTADDITHKRAHVSGFYKLGLFIAAPVGAGLR